MSETQEFTLFSDPTMKRVIERLADWQVYKTKDGLTRDREISETVHIMGKTEAFRLVVLRWQNEQQNLFAPDKYCYHAMATNLECSAEEVVWQGIGCWRKMV